MVLSVLASPTSLKILARRNVGPSRRNGKYVSCIHFQNPSTSPGGGFSQVIMLMLSPTRGCTILSISGDSLSLLCGPKLLTVLATIDIFSVNLLIHAGFACSLAPAQTSLFNLLERLVLAVLKIWKLVETQKRNVVAVWMIHDLLFHEPDLCAQADTGKLCDRIAKCLIRINVSYFVRVGARPHAKESGSHQ